MPPSQNQLADGTPPDSIGEDVNSQQPNINKILNQILAHPQTDPGVQIDHINFFVGNYGESLNEDQTRAINEKYVGCRREQEKSRRDANCEYRLNAIAQYNAAIKAVTFDSTLPATQQSKRGELCKQFPPDVRRDFKKSGMWRTPKEQHDFRRDPEKARIIKEYRKEVADCTDTVIVPRRKFHC